MATTYVYSGTLADIGMGALAGMSPQMFVRPEREAFGPDGLISAVPVEVEVAADGSFEVTLLASESLTPPTDYVIEVGRFEPSFDGPRFHGIDVWRFTALPGGGPIAGEPGSPYAVYVGPPWPEGTPPGVYIDTVPPNAWGIKTEGM